MLFVRNWKEQNTGGALAVNKGLVGQVEGRVKTLYGKKFPDFICDITRISI